MPEKDLEFVAKNLPLAPDDEILWIGRPPLEQVYSIGFFFETTLVLVAGITGVWVLGLIFVRLGTSWLSEDYTTIFNIVFCIVYCALLIVHFIQNVLNTTNQQTMIYGFTKTKAFWIWRSTRLIVKELPFSKISKLDLVTYHDRGLCYSIYFSPSETLKFGGFNYRKMDTRPFPTFEELTDGDLVFKRLQELVFKASF